MKDKERMVHDGIILAAAYHFLLALVFIIGAIAIIFYSFLPPILNPDAEIPHTLFFPIIGFVLSVTLAIGYGYVGTGLMKMKNTARMAAVFLALFGVLLGVFGVAGVLATSLNNMTTPDLVLIGAVAVAAMLLNFISILDIFILFFLFQTNVRSLFYGETIEDTPGAAVTPAASARPAPPQIRPVPTRTSRTGTQDPA